jgi:putative restriction endonuclease
MEEEIRVAAFQWLKILSEKSGGVFQRSDLERGFEFRGRRITLVGPAGIWAPRGFETPISISTTTSGPYDDGFTDDGILRYSYRGTDPQHRDNRGLRKAFQQRIPLIYFQAIKPGLYVAVWPVFILRDNPSDLCIEAAIDLSLTGVEHLTSPEDEFYSQTDSILSVRRYVTRITRQRMHQSAFREFVLDAYARRCTICRLQHPELLDAAHIIPDSHEDGLPIVPNGLSLCKIHHSAYDQHILGISPEYKVHIRKDLLDEIDGPMLKHGFQELDGNAIHIPSRKNDQPDRERLDVRFTEFLSA